MAFSRPETPGTFCPTSFLCQGLPRVLVNRFIIFPLEARHTVFREDLPAEMVLCGSRWIERSLSGVLNTHLPESSDSKASKPDP